MNPPHPDDVQFTKTLMRRLQDGADVREVERDLATHLGRSGPQRPDAWSMVEQAFAILYPLTSAAAIVFARSVTQDDEPVQFELVCMGADIDALPPGPRAAARFVAASANRDADMAYALYRAIADSDEFSSFMPEVLRACQVWVRLAVAHHTCPDCRDSDGTSS